MKKQLAILLMISLIKGYETISVMQLMQHHIYFSKKNKNIYNIQ